MNPFDSYMLNEVRRLGADETRGAFVIRVNHQRFQIGDKSH